MRRSRLIMFALLALAAPASAQVLDSATVNGFRWRTVGPANFMGRLTDIVGIPSPSKTWFVSAAGGGIWKSTNNGLTWRPLFDDKRVISIGALALAPTDTQQVWAGTGEPHTRNTIEPGGGLYKSTDGGTSWKEIPGFEKTQHIGRIVVHPTNPNIVFVAALGAVWGTNPERGIYKTTDGGTTWRKVKFINDKTGFVDIAIDPRTPNTMWASSWQMYRTPYSLYSGGPGSGLWKSTDAGENWTEIKGGGYPAGTKGRIGIAIAASNPEIVYALTEAHSMDPETTVEGQQRANGLYRTTDGGKTWEKMNSVDTRPFYYSQVRVDPKNPDRVYYSSTPVHFSNDGGRTDQMEDQQRLHVDTHGIWIDPNDPERWGQATDGGIAITFDKGGNFFYPMNLPVAQFYEVTYDNAVPYNICSGAQDNGAWCGPSKRNGDVNNSYWFTISGGDGFYTAQDPTDPNWVWGESQGGGVSGRNLKTGERANIVKPSWQNRYRELEDSIAVARGNPLAPITQAQRAHIDNLRAQQKQDSIDLTLRFNWNSPFFLSPHNPRVFYFAGNRVLKSLNRGDDLFPISPDLSKAVMSQYRTAFQARLDTSLRLTGGVSTDATGAETYGTVVALAESYVKPGMLIAGTDDGNVWITHNDGGDGWTNLNGRFPGVPYDAYVTRVEPSHFDTLTFYVAFDNHRWNDFKPYLYATNDGGKSFRSIANNLPATSQADFLHVVREDPWNRDLLFVGTSIGVYASIDRGASWTRFSPGMPSVPVYDLKIHPRDRELIAATHGRGLWIVEISGLEQITSKAMAAPAALFAPRTALQWTDAPTLGIPGNGHGSQPFTLPSPAYGAQIFYRLKDAATGGVNITVSDGTGEQIFQTNGASGPGVHSVLWPYSVTRAPVAQDPLPQSPSQRRDSILLFARAPQVLDSLTAAKYDSNAIRTVRNIVTQATATATGAGAGAARGLPPGGGGGAGGGGGGAGRGGAVPVTANCDHPITIWDTFCPRPMEAAGGRGGGGGGGAAAAPPAGRGGAAADTTAAGRGGAAGGRGAAAAAPPPPAGRGAPPAGRGAAPAAPPVDPVRRIWDIIGMNPPGAGGRGGAGGGGGGRGGAGGGMAQPGTYLVTMTVNGQTYKQTFRVERP